MLYTFWLLDRENCLCPLTTKKEVTFCSDRKSRAALSVLSFLFIHSEGQTASSGVHLHQMPLAVTESRACQTDARYPTLNTVRYYHVLMAADQIKSVTDFIVKKQNICTWIWNESNILSHPPPARHALHFCLGCFKSPPSQWKTRFKGILYSCTNQLQQQQQKATSSSAWSTRNKHEAVSAFIWMLLGIDQYFIICFSIC